MKKAQITLFIILGLVVLLIAVGVFYFVPSLKEQDTEQEIRNTQSFSTDLKPLVNYIQACANTIATEGLFLIGKQGGYLYQSQGSIKPDYRQSYEGKFFVQYNNQSVPYLIQKTVTAPACNLDAPMFPQRLYPYNPLLDPGFNNPDFVKPQCFGKPVVLDVNRSSLLLEEYINKNLASSCSFSGFPQFTITAQTPKAYVESLSTRTIIDLEWPLTIQQRDETANLDLFRTSISFSLRQLYNFANDLILEDTSDPNFVITTIDPTLPFDVRVIPDIHNSDDLVIIESPNLKLNGQSYEFIFARSNRKPALVFVQEDFSGFSTNQGSIIDWTNSLQNLEAVDPDEDDLTFTIDVGTNPSTTTTIYTQDNAQTGNNPYTVQAGDNTNMPVTISVSDGQYSDYQDFDLNNNQLQIS